MNLLPPRRLRDRGQRNNLQARVSEDRTIKSEFYKLRRTAIKDIASYVAFLLGFIGSAPFAWGLLAQQLDAGRFATGLWYFFGIVFTAGIFAGIAGLGLGMAGGVMWEQLHRHRRTRTVREGELAGEERDSVSTAPGALGATSMREQPRLQLISTAGSRPQGVPGNPVTGNLPGFGSADIGGGAPPVKLTPSESIRGWGRRDLSLRDLILAVILIGIMGLIGELVLLEHTESWKQWIPLAALGVGLGTVILVRLRPGRGAFRAFRAVMAVFLAAGLLGLYFHYAGNVEFALERTPELSGLPLFWKALRGATPTLAPGAMVQLALLGLVYAYRHPSLTEKER